MLRPGDSLTILKMALSVSFIRLVSSTNVLCSIKSSLMRDFRVRSPLPLARHAAQGSADSKGV